MKKVFVMGALALNVYAATPNFSDQSYSDLQRQQFNDAVLANITPHTLRYPPVLAHALNNFDVPTFSHVLFQTFIRSALMQEWQIPHAWTNAARLSIDLAAVHIYTPHLSATLALLPWSALFGKQSEILNESTQTQMWLLEESPPACKTIFNYYLSEPQQLALISLAFCLNPLTTTSVDKTKLKKNIWMQLSSPGFLAGCFDCNCIVNRISQQLHNPIFRPSTTSYDDSKPQPTLPLVQQSQTPHTGATSSGPQPQDTHLYISTASDMESQPALPLQAQQSQTTLSPLHPHHRLQRQIEDTR